MPTIRVEDVTSELAKSMSDAQLRDARARAAQMYARTEMGRAALRKRTMDVGQPVERDTFLAAYGAIAVEMGRRGLEWRGTDLDRKLVRKTMRGVDVAELPAITLRAGAVWLTGGFVRDPKRATTVGVWLDGDDYPQALEKRMVEALLNQTDRDVVIVDRLEAPGIPAYDLVLMPRAETADTDDVAAFAKRKEELHKKQLIIGKDVFLKWMKDEDEYLDKVEKDGLLKPVSKPYANEHAARQLDPAQFQEIHRENDKFGAGIDALWGVLANGKTKLQSIRFDASKFTVAETKAWLKDHDFKTTVEAAKPKAKSGAFCKVDQEERVVAGVVYAPMEVDSQGDWTDSGEIWKAMKHYMVETGGVMKIMHEGRRVDAPVVEVFQAEVETVKGGTTIPAGAWYQANYIPEGLDDVWQAIKEGKLTGYSMSGRAEETEAEVGMA